MRSTIETQVLMTVSDFSGVFSRDHFLEGGFTFQCFSDESGFIFSEGSGWGGGGGAGCPRGSISFDGGGLKKKIVG